MSLEVIIIKFLNFYQKQYSIKIGVNKYFFIPKTTSYKTNKIIKTKTKNDKRFYRVNRKEDDTIYDTN